MTVLQREMPAWHWCETYGIRVDAQPEAAFDALFSVTAEEMPVTRLLMKARELPALAFGRKRFDGFPTEGPVVDRMLEFGFTRLDSRDGTELAVALIDQSWKIDGGDRIELAGRDDFTAFSREGYVKIAADFVATPVGTGTFLSTQTRIAATDDRTRRIFGCYWTLIRPFSGITRRAWLGAAARRLDP